MNDREAGNGAQAAAPVVEPAQSPVGDGGPSLAVPNVSVGDDPAALAVLQEAVRFGGARLLDLHSDADHGRSVLTLVAEPLSLQDALVEVAGACVDLVDLRRHRGVHPRVGALDVVPIVALEPSDLPLASEIATGLAQRLGDELNLPVFLYGEVATDAERDRPHHFRAGGLPALERALEGGDLVPDAGPPRLHPTAGAALVGVRTPLIAWNVWLPDATLDQARAIAARVREAGGGLPEVRALGLYLPEAGAAQVSMNLEDYRQTSPSAAVAAVRREAERLGVEVGDSELIGLIPKAALAGASPSALGLRGFHAGQVVESRLAGEAR